MGVEQSNTSVAYGDGCMLKVYRRIEPGHNPEVELSRYLTVEAGFTATPRVLATGRVRASGGDTSDAVMLQEFVRNYGDGWEWAVDAARRAFGAVEDRQEAHNWDDMHEWLVAEGETLQGVATLGAVTAQLHNALAAATSDDMQPEPVTDEDFDLWNRSLLEEMEVAAKLQDRASGSATFKTTGPVGPTGWTSRITPFFMSDAGLNTRVHGDYHLGQVLRTDAGFVIVDFEGEPARSPEERRSRQHPLVDVAGMMRSWNYAALTASSEFGSRGGGEAFTLAHALTWESIVRWYFLDGYWAQAGLSARRYLPRDIDGVRKLLTFFELRKAVYELRYELNNRPDWAWIPASALTRLSHDWDRWTA